MDGGGQAAIALVHAALPDAQLIVLTRGGHPPERWTDMGVTAIVHKIDGPNAFTQSVGPKLTRCGEPECSPCRASA
jgi:hypothetical protein